MAFVQSILKDLNDAWQDSSAELSKLLLLVGRGVLASFAHFAAEKSWEEVVVKNVAKWLKNNKPYRDHTWNTIPSVAILCVFLNCIAIKRYATSKMMFLYVRV